MCPLIHRASYLLFAFFFLSHSVLAADDQIFGGVAAGVSFMAGGTAPQMPEGLIKVESGYCKRVFDSFCVVLARGSASGTAGTNGVGSLNIEYEVLGGEFDINEDQTLMLGTSLFNVSVQRNVAIDQEKFIRLSFLGFRGHGKIAASENLELFAKASLDLLELAYSKSISQVRQTNGFSTSFEAEIGAKIFKRFQVTLKEEFGMMTGSQLVQESTGPTNCIVIQNADGSVTQNCAPATQSVPRDQSWSSITTVALQAQLLKRLLLFVQGSYSYFHVSDQLGGLPDPASSSTTAVHATSSGTGVIQGEAGLEIVF